ncbi:MAG: hypothetical protein P8P30_06485 [Rickettsiales bacterium]|nr:hypothetical protein [Rickettsiales bacterium]
MWKWLLGILVTIILLVVLGFTVFIWIVMAGGLQQVVDDNLTMLKQNTILHDRELAFEYEEYGVERIGLSPALTLSKPVLVLRIEGVEYRMTAPEISFIGSFTQLQQVVLRAPEEVKLTVKKLDLPPHVFKVNLPDNIQISLSTEPAKSQFWERYQLPEAITGTLKITDLNNGTEHSLNYDFPATKRERLILPYSVKLLPVVKRISALAEAS